MKDIVLSKELNPKADGSVSRLSFDGVWRLTEIIGCPAAPLHQALGCPSRAIDAQALALFYEGILHEKDLKARIRELGYLIFEYPDGVRAKDVPVVCHPDGNLMGDEILETKSVNEATNSEEFIKAHPQYVKQVMGYMRILDMSVSRIVAKSRSTGWILDDILIEYDPAIIDPIWQNITNISKMLESGIQSCNGPWAPHCSDDFTTRLFCPFNGTHCKRSEAEATGELDSLLREYATVKPTYDKVTLVINQMRDQVKQLMTEAGVKRTRAQDGTLASLYDYRYPIADRDIARQILDPTTYLRIFSEGSTPSVRITVPKSKASEEEGSV